MYIYEPLFLRDFNILAFPARNRVTKVSRLSANPTIMLQIIVIGLVGSKPITFTLFKVLNLSPLHHG